MTRAVILPVKRQSPGTRLFPAGIILIEKFCEIDKFVKTCSFRPERPYFEPPVL